MTDTATKTSTSSVNVEGLRKKYVGNKVTVHDYAVDRVSFDVPEGQFLTLLGPSGCGKTTTLRCIAGLEEPSGGRISMGGQVVYDEARRRSIRPEDRPIGMVPQSYGIWPHMTVLQNAAFPLKYGRRRKGQRDIEKRASTMLEQVGLSAFADRWATQLSGGQQQRLALARALISEPEVLLLDEPLSNLDAKLRVKLRVELREFQKKFGVTTLYVTHDQAEALAMSDTVILMNEGQIEQVGSPEEIYSRPRTSFVADFIGSANLLPVDSAEEVADGIHARTEVGSFLCAAADQASAQETGFVCVRPENVDVVDASVRGPNVFVGTVVSAEYLGDRQDVVVDLGGANVRAAVPAMTRVRPGDAISVEIKPQHARWLAS